MISTELTKSIPPKSKKMIVAQIHSNHLIIAVQIEQTPAGNIKMFAFNHFYFINRTLDNDYVLGSKYSLKVQTTKGGISVEYWSGVKYAQVFFTYAEVLHSGVLPTACYFKIGNYRMFLSLNLEISNDTTDTSENWIYGVGVSHGTAQVNDPVHTSVVVSPLPAKPSPVGPSLPASSSVPSSPPYYHINLNSWSLKTPVTKNF